MNTCLYCKIFMFASLTLNGNSRVAAANAAAEVNNFVNYTLTEHEWLSGRISFQ
jgi:hypothetical protein